MKFNLKARDKKMLHPTLGWLNEIETIKYYTSLNKKYPYEVSKFHMLFNEELKLAYEENIKIKVD